MKNEFFAFVKSQPENRSIDHSYGWNQCAVGDFFREAKGMDFYQAWHNWFKNRGKSDLVMREFVIDTVSEPLERILNHKLLAPKTYGELQRWIADLEGAKILETEYETN